jgi:hypothetical protein
MLVMGQRIQENFLIQKDMIQPWLITMRPVYGGKVIKSTLVETMASSDAGCVEHAVKVGKDMEKVLNAKNVH